MKNKYPQDHVMLRKAASLESVPSALESVNSSDYTGNLGVMQSWSFSNPNNNYNFHSFNTGGRGHVKY